jgi:hypothetical protein
MSYPAKVYRFDQGPVIVTSIAEETALFHLGFRRSPSGRLRDPVRLAAELLRAPEQAKKTAIASPTKPVEARLPVTPGPRGIPKAESSNFLDDTKPVIEPRGRIAEAQSWLAARLTLGPARADRVKAESHAAGIAWRTCQLAATRLRVIRRKRSGTDGWTWALTPRRKAAAGKRTLSKEAVNGAG